MIKNIIFDFDGVILDAVPLKTEAFRKLFSSYPKNDIEAFIEYHIYNGGISRYKKVQYFFEKILHKTISEDEILKFANDYSSLTKTALTNPKYIIKDTLYFLKENYQNYNMHIASGADEKDLQYICKKLDLNKYFITINGSPKEKNQIVKDIIDLNKYKKNETIMIGDSINDFIAADKSGIEFYGYNNQKLKDRYKYIDNFKNISFK